MSVTSVPIFGRITIHVGYNITEFMVDTILAELPSSTYVVISDNNIAKHSHIQTIIETLESQKPDASRVLTYLVPPGELSKSRETKAKVEDYLFSEKCTRDTVILAIGGGVIGDMIGYVAATFMRGVRYVQIPTTLLAMVDSSIGGKTAIDTPSGKNLVGAFWQPALNFSELAFLETLPEREFINGMAEVIKTAAIWDENEFTTLESVNAQFLAALDKRDWATGRVDLSPIREIIHSIVLGSVRVKSEVVSKDEREGGLRNILNFGHSIGHAYEGVWTPNVLHGECVSIGMVLEADLSRYLGHLPSPAVARLIACLKSYRLPVTAKDPVVLERARGVQPHPDTLINIMAVDKKNDGQKKKVVLLKNIGETYEPKASTVSDTDLKIILSPDIIVSTPTDSPEVFTVTPPGSKSISNRVLVLAALGEGTCRISNLLHSDDTSYMLDALAKMNAAEISKEDDILVVSGKGGKVEGPGFKNELYLGNAGTAARFLTAVAAGLATGDVTLTGNKRMQERPIGALVDALRTNGAHIDYCINDGCLPLRTTDSPLQGGHIKLAATTSSQYVSAIMMVAPYAKEQVTLELLGKPISQFYIDMTVQMMADFGIKIEKSTEKEHTYIIPQGRYKNPTTYAVESDASSATYPLALAALSGAKCTVPTVGSRSLQGDARFARDVLAPMGCIVEQTETSTTVQGPPRGSLKALPHIDMEPMTDAFLTAAVVAALADGDTKISGIANQRVKECNRIEAMRTELAKFGVKAVEFEDGITVTGTNVANLQRGSTIVDSRDDHRVAMSLSLLATQAVEGAVIGERRCVEKTWPGWWDTLHALRVPLEGSEAFAKEAAKKAHNEITQLHIKRPSVILIGMRGAGKTDLSALLGSALGWPTTDLDELFEKKAQQTIPEFIKSSGWDAFRSKEATILQEFLAQNPTEHIIACGGGVVETEESREILAKWKGPVVHVHRNLKNIIDHLNLDKTRPALAESPADVYARREQWYKYCSDTFFFAGQLKSESDRLAVQSSLVRLVERKPLGKDGRFFLCLTFPDLSTVTKETFDTITDGVAAVELRVDLLESTNINFVAEQIGILRLRTALPIIFTVRTQAQGGHFRDDDDENYLKLVELGYKMGVEYADLELTQPRYVLDRLFANKGATRIIASHHDPRGEWSWRGNEWRVKLFDALRLGDIVKFVGFARSLKDNLALEEFRKSAGKAGVPLIAINMGEAGKLSRIVNTVLTPVTHESLPAAAAPGQMSVRTINEALTTIGASSPLEYFVCGHPVGHSQSPALHNATFKTLGLPHTYTKLDTPVVHTVEDHINELGQKFGGASVTIPLKESVQALCDELSEHALIIGAVNTIVPVRDEENKILKLAGYNTDYLGIVNTFKKAGILSGAGQSALIVGAGGTARAAIYAFYVLGFDKVYIINRTPEHASHLVDWFTGKLDIPVTVVDNHTKLPPLRAVLSCIPGDKEIPTNMVSTLSEMFAVPASGSRVLVEAAYKPAVTEVMKLASSHGWLTVPGRQMLVLQGIEQSLLWTSLEAPHSASKAVLG